MSDPALAMQTRLKTLTDITTLTGTRIYRVGSVPPTPQMPYIIVNAPISDIDDGSTNTSDNSATRIQVSAFASTDPAVETISQLLKKKVPCNDTILQAGTDFLRVTRIKDGGAIADQNADVPVYIRHRDFLITYTY